MGIVSWGHDMDALMPVSLDVIQAIMESRRWGLSTYTSHMMDGVWAKVYAPMIAGNLFVERHFSISREGTLHLRTQRTVNVLGAFLFPQGTRIVPPAEEMKEYQYRCLLGETRLLL